MSAGTPRRQRCQIPWSWNYIGCELPDVKNQTWFSRRATCVLNCCTISLVPDFQNFNHQNKLQEFPS